MTHHIQKLYSINNLLLKKSRFSLIEFLLVGAILIMIFSLLIPSLKKVFESSNILSCQTNIRPLAISEQLYSGDYGDVMYFRETNVPAVNRHHWNNGNSSLADYFDQELLVCPNDPFGSTDTQWLSFVDGPSYGRTGQLHHSGPTWSEVQNPDKKVFYSDSGHLLTTPREREQGTRGRVHSSSIIGGARSWEVNGVYPRHLDDKANILFIDGHVELWDYIKYDEPFSINYTLTEEIFKKHWQINENF